MDTTQKILSDNTKFLNYIAELRTIAPFFPRVHFSEYDNMQWINTMVRFTHAGNIYKRHHIESGKLSKTCTVDMIYKLLMDKAEKSIMFGIPCQFDELIHAKT